MDAHTKALEALRWLACVPGAVLCAWISFMVMQVLGRFSLSYAGVEPGDFWFSFSSSTIDHGVMGGVFVYIGARIAPRRNVENRLG